MDALLRLINEPGIVRWIVDGLLIPLLVVVTVIVMRAAYLAAARRRMRRYLAEAEQASAAEAGEGGQAKGDEQAGAAEPGEPLRRQTSAFVAWLIGLAAVTIIWHYRLEDLAGRPDAGLPAGFVDVLEGTISAVIVTIGFGLVVYSVNRLFRYTTGRLASSKEARTGVRMQGMTVISPAQVRQFIVLAMRVARFVLFVALLYLYVPLILSLLPPTRPLAGRVVPLVMGPVRNLAVGFVGYLPRLLSLIIIILIVRYLLRLFGVVMGMVGRGTIRIPGFDPEWADQTTRLVKIIAVLATMMIVYPFLPGAGSDVFKGFSLFVGAVFTLGASSSVSNLISGIILTYTRSFRIDDRISIGGTTGDVIARGLFVTRIRTVYNEEVTVPNNVGLGGRVVNYSAAARSGGLALRVEAGIGYDVDWRLVHELMKDAAVATDGIAETPEPFVLQTQLGNYAVHYELLAWTRDAKSALRTESELRSNVMDAFHRAGVEIMTPAVSAVRNAGDEVIPGADDTPPQPGILRFLGLRPDSG